MAVLAPLTVQERRSLELVAAGETNVEIGAGLNLSAETVKSHLKRAFWKLEARNRAHAVAIALEHGLLGPNRQVAVLSNPFLPLMPVVSRALARQDWGRALEVLRAGGVTSSAALLFVGGERERAVAAGVAPARDRG